MKLQKPVIRALFYYVIVSVVIFGCGKVSEGQKISSALGVKDNPESPFYLALNEYKNPEPEALRELPVGVFDSGTGGLTVLEKILENDEYDNKKYEIKSDGTPDLAGERFVYFGDAANMPYGNYPSENNVDFLKELALKDVLFLLNNKYDKYSEVPESGKKSPVKIIVIACNTATAYGKKDIEEMVDFLGLNIDVIGVIDAGVEGALEFLEENESGTIGVMATVGTVLSESYPRTIRRMAQGSGYSGQIEIVQQGGYGLAGAIDGDKSYCDPGWEKESFRDEYIGPSMMNESFPVKKENLPLYHFVNEGNELIIKKDKNGNIVDMQLNSVRNYIRYHVTELVLQIKENQLKAVILGCTHYPYYTDEIKDHLRYLAEYEDSSGEKPFSKYLSGAIAIIDPAVLTARQTLLSLVRRGLKKPSGESQCDFYISVPNKNAEGVVLNPHGGFTYEYKYGRKPSFISNAAIPPKYVLRVPMLWERLDSYTIDRIGKNLPLTYSLMTDFNSRNN